MGGFAGFVLLRLRAHRLLLAAALVSILVTTTVLAALAGFTSGVADAGVRRVLGTADAAATPLLLTRHAGYADRAESDREARRLAATALPGLPLEIRSVAVSDGFGLPGGAANNPDVTSLASLDQSRLRLLQGSWPTSATPGPTGPVQIAVPRAAVPRLAQSLGGGSVLGARLTLTDQVSKARLTVLVTGVYRAADPADRYWQLDALGGRGIQRATGSTGSAAGSAGTGTGGTSYGPMLVADTAFSGGAVPQSQLSWQAVPATDRLHAADLATLAAANRAATAGINQQGTYQAVSNLPTVLDELRQSILVARSTLLVVVLQLALLTAMTLLLAARLLAEEREGENALLRARGAAPRAIVRLAAAEALLLALPAAVLAPLLAQPLIRLLAALGPLSSAGVRLDGPLPGSAWWTALLTALGCALVVVAPTLTRAGGARPSGPSRGRRGALPSVLRGGADLALVALAVAAYLELRHYAGTGTLGGGTDGGTAGGLSGSLGVDPVLVAAPALALAAGTVLTLRLLPLVARIGERLATRGRALPVALAAWQLSRRTHRSAGPVLALALAAAIGTLAIGQNVSWEQSQRDQAAFNTGGDIRVAALRVPALGQGGMLAALPGVAAAVPVNRQQIGLAGGHIGELIAYDTRAEADRLPLRADLADRSAAQLLGGLADPVPPTAQQGVPLPGRPARLDLDAQLTVAGQAADQSLSDSQVAVTVQVVDRFGLAYTLDSRSVALDGRAHRLEFDLRAAAGSGTPGYPLTVSRIDIGRPVALARRDATRQPHPRLGVVLTLSADGAPASAPAGLGWSARIADSDDGQSGPPYQPGRVTTARTSGAAALTAQLELGTFWDQSTGGSFDAQQTPDVVTSFTPARPAPTVPLAALADQRFLDANHVRIGSVLILNDAGGGLRVRITGMVRQLPGTGAAAEQGLDGQTLGTGSGFAGADPRSSGGALLVDLPSYTQRLNGAGTADGNASALPVEWWLATTADGRARADAALAADSDVAVFYDRSAVAAAAAHDPIGSGPQSALLAGMVLAVVLASVGFAANASGTVRARATEFAVLRALGMSRRRMARATAAELALPIVLGVGVGLLLGEVITRLVVPLLVLTAQATTPVPTVLVQIPVLPLAGLLAAVAAVPLLCAVLAGFRGGDPARRLRTPEEF